MSEHPTSDELRELAPRALVQHYRAHIDFRALTPLAQRLEDEIVRRLELCAKMEHGEDAD